MQPDLTIKPVFAAFVLRPALQFACLFTILTSSTFSFILEPESRTPGIAALFVLITIAGIVGYALSHLSRFRKTSYNFYPDRIVLHTGGLLDYKTVDLQIKNITQVSASIPYLEHRFFQTGHVFIQAAGSADTEIAMQSILNPLAFYNEVAARMQQNGFAITRQNKIQEEQPGLLGTFVQFGEVGVSFGFAIAYLAFSFLTNLLSSGSADDASKIASSINFFSVISIALTTIGILIALTAVILRALDLTRRNYILYNDVIDYQDGFLNQNFKFIPIENLADVTLSQSFLRRLFDISDLKVSCQGADADITFQVMPRAETFKQNLEQLINQYKQHKLARLAERNFEHPDAAHYDVHDTWGQPQPYATPHTPNHAPTHPHFTAAPQPHRALNRPPLELRIDLKRAIGGSALLYGLFALAAVIAILMLTRFIPSNELFDGASTLLVVGAIGLIFCAVTGREAFRHFIAFQSTRFRVTDTQIGLHHTMFNKHHVEFSIDKITSVSIQHDIFDRLFGTASITFHSIGSNKPIVFTHIPNGYETSQDILERLGLHKGAITRTLTPAFSAASAVRAHLGTCAEIIIWLLASLIFAIYMPISVIQFAIVLPLLLGLYLYKEAVYKKTRLEIFQSHLHLRTGLFKITNAYTGFNHIKHVQTARYFDTTTGVLRLTVAGGTLHQLPYLTDVDAHHEQFDALLYNFPAKPVHQPAHFTPTPIASAQRATPNAMTQTLLVSVLLFPLIALLPITLPITSIRTRRFRYTAESQRISAVWGRLYPTRQTILYNRIDHLTTNRNFLNSIFKNGSIGIATTGSTGTDLTLHDLNNHTEIYEAIKQNLPRDIANF